MYLPPPSTPNTVAFTHKPFVWLRNKLLAGLALALPLLITWWVLEWGYRLLHGFSEPMLNGLANMVNNLAAHPVVDLQSEAFKQIVKFIGFLIPLLALVALGVMATNVIGGRVVAAFDMLLSRVPIVSFIYKSLKQVIDAFRGLGGRQNFKRVVYVDYPMSGMRMLGFVTGQYYDSREEKDMAAIFVPGALSPMTGLLLVVEASKVTDAPISIEDAMKLIFSGGLVVPVETSASPPQTGSIPIPQTELRDIEAADLPLTKDMPVNLPRAEDFDFGDPDILATTVTGGKGSKPSRGWRDYLPWTR
jgi:uncharacterized membrane protein